MVMLARPLARAAWSPQTALAARGVAAGLGRGRAKSTWKPTCARSRLMWCPPCWAHSEVPIRARWIAASSGCWRYSSSFSSCCHQLTEAALASITAPWVLSLSLTLAAWRRLMQ